MPKPLEVAQVSLLHVGDQRFLAAPFLASADHDRGAVRVVGAEVEAAVAAQLLKAHPDVGLDVLHQMAQMDVTIGIGQGGGNENLACGHGGRSGPVVRIRGNRRKRSIVPRPVNLSEPNRLRRFGRHVVRSRLQCACQMRGVRDEQCQ